MKPINITKIISAFDDTERVLRNPETPEAYRQALKDRTEAFAPIASIIEQIEGRATARTLTVRDMVTLVRRLESTLRISKRAMVGIRATIDVNAQAFPKAYKKKAHGAAPQSTIYEVERRKSGWYVTDIYRGECRRVMFSIELTDSAESEILDQYRWF